MVVAALSLWLERADWLCGYVFTAQLAEIKKVTLAGVLCDAFDDDFSIQPDAFGLAKNG